MPTKKASAIVRIFPIGHRLVVPMLPIVPKEDVERMLKMDAPTLADVVMSVGTLEKTVEELTHSTKTMAVDLGWIKKLLFAILVALVVGIVIKTF